MERYRELDLTEILNCSMGQGGGDGGWVGNTQPQDF